MSKNFTGNDVLYSLKEYRDIVYWEKTNQTDSFVYMVAMPLPIE